MCHRVEDLKGQLLSLLTVHPRSLHKLEAVAEEEGEERGLAVYVTTKMFIPWPDLCTAWCLDREIAMKEMP